MKFTKMHGLGNDYLYVYGDVPENIAELSQKLSERHFGAGSDGMIYISRSDIADFKMRIFNADGSEAKMCGNGIRCVGKFVYDKGYTDKKFISIETLSGVKYLTLQVAGGKVKTVAVDMGQAKAEKPINLTVDGETVSLIPVSVGNPHAVIFVDDIEKAPLTKLGPIIEHHEAFPDGVNVETVALLSQRRPDEHIDITIDLTEFDTTAAELKATYPEIKEYVLNKFGLKVSSLYISQVKTKCGIIERENYNKGKAGHRVPQCPKEKEDAIMDALKHFKMI